MSYTIKNSEEEIFTGKGLLAAIREAEKNSSRTSITKEEFLAWLNEPSCPNIIYLEEKSYNEFRNIIKKLNV